MNTYKGSPANQCMWALSTQNNSIGGGSCVRLESDGTLTFVEYNHARYVLGSVNTEQWYFVEVNKEVVVDDDDIIRGFLDGVKCFETTTSFAISGLASIAPFIGTNGPSSKDSSHEHNETFNGIVDDLVWYRDVWHTSNYVVPDAAWPTS